MYKFLLYEQGEHFKPHQDSEKAPRMFATLAICLPTAHEGGELVLEHGGKRRVWKSSQTSMVDLSYAAWYADVTHEVKPVTSGHRAVLTYNVVNDSPPQKTQLPTASALGNKDYQLRQVLSQWGNGGAYDDEGESIPFMYHQLSHEYTEESLSLSCLKGRDVSVVNRTARVAEQTDFFVYLATFEMMQEGGCDGSDEEDHEIIDEVDSHWKLMKLVGLDGKVVAEDVDIEEHQMVDPDAFDGKSPDDEEFTGRTGNEGASTTLWYRRTMMILMPKSNELAFVGRQVLQGSTAFEPWAKRLLAAHRENPHDTKAKTDLTKFCVNICGRLRMRESGSSALPIEYHLPSLLTRGDEHLTASDKAMLIVCCAWVGLEPSCRKLLSFMPDPMTAETFAALREPILDSGKFCEFRSFLTEAVSKKDEISTVLQAADQFLGPADFIPHSPEVSQWYHSITDAKLDAREHMTKEDAGMLMQLCARFGVEFYEKAVLPRALVHKSQAWFSLEVGRQLCNNIREGATLGADPTKLGEDVTRIVHGAVHGETKLQPVLLGERATIGGGRYYWPGMSSKESRDKMASKALDQNGTPYGDRRILHYIDPTTAADVHGYISSTGPGDEHLTLLQVLIGDALVAAQVAPTLYPRMLLPLADRLRERHGLKPERLVVLIASIYSGYMKDYVGPRPLPPTLDMGSLSCACNDCKEISQFLSDPQRKQLKFSVNQKRRKHVGYELSREYPDTVSHETEYVGKPQSLIIVKRPDKEYNVKLRPWVERAAQAKAVITFMPKDQAKMLFGGSFFAALPEDSFKALLGDAFEAVWSLRPLGHSAGSNPQPLTEILNPPQQAPHVPAKRKAESDVIDLTG